MEGSKMDKSMEAIENELTKKYFLGFIEKTSPKHIRKDGTTMQIGITEHGDPGKSMCWLNKAIADDNIKGMILITKTITKQFGNAVLKLMHQKPIIIHATCTGWGCTPMEPKVFSPDVQFKSLNRLIKAGFPAKNVVIRLDPIIPIGDWEKRVRYVLNCALGLQVVHHDIKRVRVSVMDNYKHVQARFNDRQWKIPYDSNFHAPQYIMENIAKLLKEYSDELIFETCAEDGLARAAACQGYNMEMTGCLSMKDLDIMGLLDKVPTNISINPQNRGMCKCLNFKTELFPRDRKYCDNGCVYCFWKDSY